MSEIISIGLALETSQLLAGTRQVDAALKAVATASTATAQATQKLDQAAKAAGQAFGAESTAAQAVGQSLRQKAIAAQDAEQKTRAMQQAAQTAAAALQKEQQAALAAAEALHKKGQATQTTTGLMDQLKASVGNFAKQLGAFTLAQVGVQGLQAAFQTAKDALVDLVKTGISMQNLRTSFAAASGSAQAGAKDFQFVTKTALDLGLGLQSVAAQYRSLSAATKGTSLQGAETREIFVTLTKAAQAYGLSNEQLGRALAAVQQIVSKGKVSMEELRGQLAEALPGAVQVTARAFQTTTEGLEDLVAKGLDGAQWARRFGTQLASELPPAAERAGKGITNLGTEITFLKEAMAQSGLLRWLDAGIEKTAQLLGLFRKARAEQRQTAEYEGKKSLGPGVSLDKLTREEREKLLEVTTKLNIEEQRVEGMKRARAQPGTGFLTPEFAITQAQKRVDALRQEVEAIGRAATARSGREQAIASRQAELAEPGKARKAQQQEEKDLQTFLKGARAREDAAKKAEAALQTTSTVGLGRDPTLEEKVKLQEKLVQDNQAWLEDNQKFAEQAKDDPAVKALRARGKAQEAATKALKDAKTDAKDDAREAKTDAAEQERLDKERRNNVMDTGKQVLEGYEKEGELIGQLHERVKQLTMTEAERLALQVQAIDDPALRAYAEELVKQVDAAQRFNDALKERNELLKVQAQTSAARLSDLEKAMADVKPGRKGEKPEETQARLDAAYAALTQTAGVTGLQLTQASEKMAEIMKTALDTEPWKQWEEVGLNALDHVGQAIEDFAFKGKLTFQDMLGAIAQDLFRFSMQQLMQSATKQGGWLELGLDLGMKALSAFGGGGMPTSGTLPTTEAAYAAQAAAGRFSGRASGGPVSAGVPYWVGERGPELVVPRTSGTVVPASQAQAPLQVVNHFHIQTPDVQGFQQSRGAISRSIIQGITQARQQL